MAIYCHPCFKLNQILDVFTWHANQSLITDKHIALSKAYSQNIVGFLVQLLQWKAGQKEGCPGLWAHGNINYNLKFWGLGI